MSGTLPSPSDARPRLVVVANPGCRRVELLETALHACGAPPSVLLPWAHLARGRADLRDVARPGDVLRIESPGRCFEAERALLELGAGQPDEDGYARLSVRKARALEPDRGRIFYPRQWYLGFRALLRRLEEQLADFPGCLPMSCPAEIAVMFDKPECHARLAAAGVAVPEALGPVSCFEELRERMRRRGWRRLFLKPAHGSSASGVMAYRTGGDRHQAVTTVETVRAGGELRLYNSRRLRTYRAVGEIAELVNELCRHRLHVERWLPKARLGGGVFDLRVLVIRGRAAHRVVRTSRSPITNLHLLNRRGDEEAARDSVGEPTWTAALAECERAMACFPRSLHGGVDLLITGGGRRAVLEVNAFGDLLPGLLHEGRDTYAAEIAAIYGGGTFAEAAA